MRSFQILLKDTRIIQSGVMQEYDAKVRAALTFVRFPHAILLTVPMLQFVNPRVHPVRRDAAVMTHQAEMIDA